MKKPSDSEKYRTSTRLPFLNGARIIILNNMHNEAIKKLRATSTVVKAIPKTAGCKIIPENMPYKAPITVVISNIHKAYLKLFFKVLF